MADYIAKLVGFTTPTEEFIRDMIESPEDLIAYCARVSNPSNQLNTQTASKLLDYCARNNHWSIFEMCNAVVEINLTRDIGRQVLRHRSFSFQEFSQRYASVAEMHPMVCEVRLQDTKNRQNSIATDDEDLALWWNEKQYEIWLECMDLYKEALDRGIAKELARKVMPEGLTPSRMYMNGTIRSWIHYIGLRTGHGTQKEHIDVARAIGNVLIPIYPDIVRVMK